LIPWRLRSIPERITGTLLIQSKVIFETRRRRNPKRQRRIPITSLRKKGFVFERFWRVSRSGRFRRTTPRSRKIAMSCTLETVTYPK